MRTTLPAAAADAGASIFGRCCVLCVAYFYIVATISYGSYAHQQLNYSSTQAKYHIQIDRRHIMNLNKPRILWSEL